MIKKSLGQIKIKPYKMDGIIVKSHLLRRTRKIYRNEKEGNKLFTKMHAYILS